MDDSPPLAVIRCAKEMSSGWKGAWEVKNIQGTWQGVVKNLTCTTGKWGISRCSLLHALLPEEGPWTSCRIHEVPWPQLRDGPQLGPISKMRGDRSLQCGTGFLTVPAPLPSLFLSCRPWGSWRMTDHAPCHPVSHITTLPRHTLLSCTWGPLGFLVVLTPQSVIAKPWSPSCQSTPVP